MPDYRLYLKDGSGFTIRRVDLLEAHPVRAIREAEELTPQGPVELWEGTRLIQRFPARVRSKAS